MRFFFTPLLCLILAAPVFPAAAQDQSVGVDSIVAIVNDDVITRREAEREMIRVVSNLRDRELPIPEPAVVRARRWTI